MEVSNNLNNQIVRNDISSEKSRQVEPAQVNDLKKAGESASSELISDLKKLSGKEIIEKTTPSRSPEELQELKAKINSGQYKINHEKVAQQLLSSEDI